MSTYPNYTLTQLAELILQFETKEGLSPAALANLKEFASSALENASQQTLAPDAAIPCEETEIDLGGLYPWEMRDE